MNPRITFTTLFTIAVASCSGGGGSGTPAGGPGLVLPSAQESASQGDPTSISGIRFPFDRIQDGSGAADYMPPRVYVSHLTGFAPGALDGIAFSPGGCGYVSLPLLGEIWKFVPRSVRVFDDYEDVPLADHPSSGGIGMSIDPHFEIRLVRKDMDKPSALAFGAGGTLYVGSGTGSWNPRSILRIFPEDQVPGGLAASSNPVTDPDGVVVESTGQVLVGGLKALWEISSFNQEGTDVFRAGGFKNINDAAIDPADVVYLAENDGRVWKVGADNVPKVVFQSKWGSSSKPEASIAVDPRNGDLYVVLRNQGNLYRVTFTESGAVAAEALVANLHTLAGVNRINRIEVHAWSGSIFATGTNSQSVKAKVFRYDPETNESADLLTGMENLQNAPDDLAFDPAGRLFVSTPNSGRIYLIRPTACP